MLKSGLVILSGNAASALLMLIRGLLVARLISIEDFGIASTLIISVALVEMMSALGMQQQIVQSKDGDNPHLQAVLQAFQVARATMNAVVLFLLSPQIAAVMGVPEVTWAFQVMAVGPLLNGLVHFDIYRLNRQMVYLPAALSTTLPVLASLLMVWPLHLMFGDYRVMLYAVLAQGALAVAVSHLVARRPYRWAFDRQIIAGSLRFGWPIMLDGMLLFLVFNGEKLIVGREIGMAALAIFSMGLTLTQTPGLVVERSVQAFFLPQLSAAQEAPDRFAFLATAAIQCHLLFGTALVTGVLILGAPVVWLLLGAKYAALVPLMTWFAIQQGLRIAKGGMSCVSLARAQTVNSLIANLLRVLLLPLAWLVAVRGGDLVLVIWIAILGELAGLAVSLYLAQRRLGLPLRPLAAPLCVLAALLVLAAVAAGPASGRLSGSPDPGSLDLGTLVQTQPDPSGAAVPGDPAVEDTEPGDTEPGDTGRGDTPGGTGPGASGLWPGLPALLVWGGALGLCGLCLVTMKDLRRYVRQRRFVRSGD